MLGSSIFKNTTSRLRLVVLVFAAALLTACQGEVDVNVVVAEDGSGVVSVVVALDEEAAAQVIDLDSERGLPLIDLNEADWTIDPPTLGDDGMTRIGVEKAFGTPEQFAQIMTEISGEDGLFQDFQLVRTKSFARVDYEVTGTIQPGGLAPFADEDLEAALGRTIDEMAERLGGSASDVDVDLVVSLPGDRGGEGNATGFGISNSDPTRQRWTANLADTGPTPVSIASSSRGVAALVWRGVAILAGVLAALVLLGHALRLVRPQRRRKSGGPDPKRPMPSAKGPAKAAKPDAVTTAPATDSGSNRPKVVALDGMGVLYREGSDITELLIPFAREMGSEVTSDEIAARARALSLGRITPADFWKSIGLAGDANELDEMFLARHQLSPGVVKFLRDLRERGIRVACITNDSTAWANKLRARHSLTGLIDPWVISGAVGIRKPDKPIYEVLRRVTNEAPGDILVVDDQLDNLDSAREMGFRTAWFAPAGDAAGARGHAILRSFAIAPSDDEANAPTSSSAPSS